MSSCRDSSLFFRIGHDTIGQLGRASLLAVGFALMPMSGAWAQKGPHIFLGTEETGARLSDAASLRALAVETDEIKIIVGLEASFDLEGILSENAIGLQRAQIASRQQDVLSRLSSPKNVARFETIPFVGMTVSEADLDRLLASPGITSISLDIPKFFSLKESVRVVDAPPLWRAGADGTGYSVVVIDTGARPNHAAFSGKIVASACFSTTDGSSTTVCPNGTDQQISRNGSRAGRECDTALRGCGHGTHVAAIAAGEMRRDSGMARGANVIPIQVASNVGTGVRPFVTDMIKGLELALQWRKRFNIVAVNMSIGGGQYFGPCDAANPAMSAIIHNLRSAGVATVVSSGNDEFGDSISAPACISAAVSVGSTTKQDTVSWFSNHATMLNLLAPGSEIVAADANGARNALTTKSGTSMAAPHVAGAFAMLKSHKPSATIDQIERALVCSGVPVAEVGIPKPRISMRAAREYLDTPDTRKSWNFQSDGELHEWSTGSGTWFREGNTMRVDSELGRYFYNATAPFCGDNMRARVRMSFTSPDFTRFAGVTLSTDMSPDGDFAGLFFAYGPASETSIRAGIYHVNSASAYYNAISFDEPLCFNGSVLTGIDPSAPVELRATKDANALGFSINGVDVCAATTDSRYANGRVGLLMETTSDMTGFSMTVNQVALRALGGPRGYMSGIGGASGTGGASLSGAPGGLDNVLASGTLLP